MTVLLVCEPANIAIGDVQTYALDDIAYSSHSTSGCLWGVFTICERLLTCVTSIINAVRLGSKFYLTM